MAEQSKDHLKPLSNLLGVDISGDADLRVHPGNAEEGKLLRIKSLGAHAYDITTSVIVGKPKEQLGPLEQLTGLNLQGDATVIVSAANGVDRTLRIKSLGAHAYDISVS